MEDAGIWGMIDAQPVVFPSRVQELNSAVLNFTVAAEAARPLLTGDGFELVESPAGTAHLLLGANEYRRGSWGPCNIVEVMLRARPTGARDGSTGLYLCDAPVSHPFIREAAHRSLGTVRRLEEVEVVTTADDVTFTVSGGAEPNPAGEPGEPGQAGEPGMTLRLPRVPPDHEPLHVRIQAYSHRDGEPHVIPLALDLPASTVPPEDVHLELGSGWFADMLRGLGLPRQPDRCSWGEGLTQLLHMAVPLAEAEGVGRTPVPGANG